ncbi:O-acetyltransferase OatA [Burkholderiales bacterium 8X]|nr:O-acetyltransferase OatA [Burkholderiales bacterium 8X]
MQPQEEASPLAHPKYRPDIDGLRAIAVLSVVGFHAFPQWVRGGFIGVDIFFVISGYLISTIIFGSLAGAGFSYREFYARRVRRIFPALLVVLATVIAFGWYVLLADEFRQLGKHVVSSAAFVVNLVLWGEAGYFDTVAETKPLLHMWSLAVEEQFYIFWPLILGLAFRTRGRKLWLWIVGATVVSFLINVIFLHRYPTATFYSPISRVWELAAGALLAHRSMTRAPHRTALRRELRSIGGLALLVLGLSLITRNKAFPGFWAILPVLGTYLCISAGPGAWLNRHLLGAKPMVWVGLISYPLYLWHWPLLAYLRIVEGAEPERNHRIAAVVAAFVLAWLTYWFVERRLRQRQGPRVVWGLSMAMVLLAAIGALAYSRWLPPRNNDPTLQAIMSASSDWAFPDNLREVTIKGENIYRIGDGKERVLLIGDSHVEQYGPRAVEIEQTAPGTLKTLYFATRGACPPIPQLFEDRDVQCGERREQMMRFALSPDIDTVVIGGCWTCYLDVGQPSQAASAPPPPDNYYYLDLEGRHPLRGGDGVPRAMASLESLIKLLRASNKKVFLILNLPVGNDFEPRLLISGNRLGQMSAARSTATGQFPPTQRALHDRLKAMAESNGATVIDPVPTLCNAVDQCLRSDAEGVPIYKDGVHLRARFVRSAATFLDAAITTSSAAPR